MSPVRVGARCKLHSSDEGIERDVCAQPRDGGAPARTIRVRLAPHDLMPSRTGEGVAR
jgi:hypothetical protein